MQVSDAWNLGHSDIMYIETLQTDVQIYIQGYMYI
jgi:hypothetical protein